MSNTISKPTLMSLVGLVAIGTVANVWTYLTPAVASVVKQQEKVDDRMEYMQNRIDEIHKAVGAKKEDS